MVKLNMASVVTFHMKLSHIYKCLIIWLGLHRALCVLDVTNSDIVKRRWPYPILPGNFEDLTNNLELCNKKKQESTTDKLVHSPTLKQIATSLAENKTVNLAAVYDDVLSQKSMMTLQMYGSIAADWRFSQRESMPWSTWLNSTVVSSTEVNKVFSLLVGDIKQNAKEYYPYETTLHILRRGDSVSLIQGDSEEVILIYFLKDDWQINSYGELNLYKGEEIEMSVKPSFNRAIVWNGSLAYLPKSPSMNCEGSLYFLMIKYTSNMTKVDLFEARRLHHIEEKKSAERNMFHSMMDINGHYGNLDVANHVTKDYTGTNGRKIYVFDDLFLRDDLLNLRKHVEDYGDYYFDDSHDEDSDNVQWISAINIELFIKSRLWKVVQRMAEFVSGVSTWYPYDIACNNIRAFDSTQNHQDCETWEDEWTFLLYLTPNWTIDYGGETAFYSDSEKLEYITSIRPKYGRAVIFEGIIPHSARPPSSVHLGPRFTFAVKLAINPWTALKKAIVQEVAHEEHVHYAALSLLQKYYSDQLDLLEREETPMHQHLRDHLRQTGDEDEDGVELEEDEEEMEEEEEIRAVCEPGSHCTENLHPSRYTADAQMKELIAGILEEDEDSIEDSFIDLSEFPEVLLRKLFIYQAIADAGTNYEELNEIQAQFFLDISEMQRRYVKLLELLL